MLRQRASCEEGRMHLVDMSETSCDVSRRLIELGDRLVGLTAPTEEKGYPRSALRIRTWCPKMRGC